MICILFTGFFSALGQEFNKERTFSMWFGVRDIKIPPLQNNGEMDFYQYFISDAHDENASSYQYMYSYLGFAWLKRWNEKYATDLKLTMNSGLKFNTVYLSGIYYPAENLGLTLTLYSYPQWLNEIDGWLEKENPGFYNYYDQEDWPQWSVYNHTLSAGINFPLKTGILRLQPGFRAGVAVNSMTQIALFRKENITNYRERIEYKLQLSPSLFIQPEIKLNLDLIKLKKTAIGFQFQSSYLWMKKRINYKKTVYAWTMENPQTSLIRGNYHRYTNFEFDGGLFIRW